MRRIVTAVAISVLAHAALLSWEVTRQTKRPIAERATLVVGLTRERTVVPDTTAATSPTNTPAESTATSTPQQKNSAPKDPIQPSAPATLAQPIAPVKEPASSIQLRRQLLSSLRNNQQSDAFQRFEAVNCAEIRSVIRQITCIESSPIDRRLPQLAALVRASIAIDTPKGVRKKLERVDQLLLEIHDLANTDTDDPVLSATLRQQQHLRRAELDAIDAELGSINLLKIISAATRAAKGLRRELSE